MRIFNKIVTNNNGTETVITAKRYYPNNYRWSVAIRSKWNELLFIKHNMSSQEVRAVIAN